MSRRELAEQVQQLRRELQLVRESGAAAAAVARELAATVVELEQRIDAMQLEPRRLVERRGLLPMDIDDGSRLTCSSMAGGGWPPEWVELRRDVAGKPLEFTVAKYVLVGLPPATTG